MMVELLEALKRGKCFITYKKIDSGELREMECTLDPDLIPRGLKINQNSDGSNIVVWCIDKNAWRSFRVNTMKGWRTK